jgi:hypothetical protein
LIAPAVALVLPQLAGTDVLRDRFPEASPFTTAYGVAFVAIGAALAAQSRGNYDYLTGLAPRPQLPAYAGLSNAVLAVVAFAPVLGGVVIQRSGYEALFGIVAALGLAAVFASGWLADTPWSARDHLLLGRGAGYRALCAGRA